jgi:hypothetical protein
MRLFLVIFQINCTGPPSPRKLRRPHFSFILCSFGYHVSDLADLNSLVANTCYSFEISQSELQRVILLRLSILRLLLLSVKIHLAQVVPRELRSIIISEVVGPLSITASANAIRSAYPSFGVVSGFSLSMSRIIIRAVIDIHILLILTRHL